MRRLEEKPSPSSTHSTKNDIDNNKKKLALDKDKHFYDFTDKVIMPGLVDLHVHLKNQAERNGKASSQGRDLPPLAE